MAQANILNEKNFLASDQAFQFHAESKTNNTVSLSWKIQPNYYLYHQQFKVFQKKTPLEFQLPEGSIKDDPTFGKTEVHYAKVGFDISVKPSQTYTIQWQGCSADGLCYPLQTKQIKTDQDGLIPQSNGIVSDQVGISTQNKLASNPLGSSQIEKNSVQIDYENNNDISNYKSNLMSLQWNDDKFFSSFLNQDSIFLNGLIFFLLGVLLAFLPCSLPLIPILSGIILQKKSGYKAMVIAATFVISMAMIYGLMGAFVSQIGYSFQRWFQHPAVLVSFATVFVIFALNLFGLFNLSLPASFTQKLAYLQNKQKGGTLISVSIMGALSALIVGPCMSAPLAGALLFVSQIQNTIMGGLYLFILGLGIGLPLFIFCVFGSRLLPKPGEWMNQLKISFGFMMLILSIYFLRPLLMNSLYVAMIGTILLIWAIYILNSFGKTKSFILRWFRLLFAIGLISLSFWQFYESFSLHKVKHDHLHKLTWHTVNNASFLKIEMQKAKALNRPIILDVYADWCVACQPIEREVFSRVDVQEKFSKFHLIQLDLSEYHESQDLILKQWQILGPPTLLFISPMGQENRNLRLTGTFDAEQLINRIETFEKP